MENSIIRVKGMENSIIRVKGMENLFNKYITDSEKELHKRKRHKTFKEVPAPIDKLLQDFLKELEKRKISTNGIKIKNVSPTMNIPNETNKRDGTKGMPLSKILGVIQYNIELMVNKLMEIFKNHQSPVNVDNCQRKDLNILSYDNIITKNKRRNNYYVNCNRLNRFGYKRAKNYRNRNITAMNMMSFQEYKRIIDLGRMENNLLIDWKKYGQHFCTGRNQIPVDLMNKNNTKMDDVGFISHLANKSCSEMNTIVCYNNVDNKTDYDDKHVRFVDKTIEEDEDQPTPRGSRRDSLKNKTIKSNDKNEYLVYSGFMPNNVIRKMRVKGNGENDHKSKNEKLKKKFTNLTKSKTKHQEKSRFDFCFVCKKMKTCLCGTKPDVVSETPSTEYKELEEMVDPDALYGDDNENDYLKQTYVYTAISEPRFNIHDPNEDKSENPVICSIDITGPDTGNIVIKDGEKLHNLGFKINDWYLKPTH